MKAIDIIKKAKNEGKALTVWFGLRYNWNDDERETSQDPNIVERITGFFDDRDKAWDAIKEEAESHDADFGRYDDFEIHKAEIDNDVIEDVDWSEIEKYPDSFDDEDLWELINDNGFYDYDDIVAEVSYDYPSVSGALLVTWSWNRYVGYSRDIHEIRIGLPWEKEDICVKKDKTWVLQCDVLATASELEGLSKKEERDLIEERLFGDDWRWTRKAISLIHYELNNRYKEECEDDD